MFVKWENHLLARGNDPGNEVWREFANTVTLLPRVLSQRAMLHKGMDSWQGTGWTMAMWTCGHVDHVDLWTCGRVEVWTCGRVKMGTCERVNVWTCERVDLWTCGRVDV